MTYYVSERSDRLSIRYILILSLLTANMSDIEAIRRSVEDEMEFNLKDRLMIVYDIDNEDQVQPLIDSLNKKLIEFKCLSRTTVKSRDKRVVVVIGEGVDEDWIVYKSLIINGIRPVTLHYRNDSRSVSNRPKDRAIGSGKTYMTSNLLSIDLSPIIVRALTEQHSEK